MSIVRSSLPVFCMCLALSACGGGDTIPSRYALGPLSQTGSLSATGVSLVRRGSHVLTIDGETAFFVESKTQNLQEFDGKEVYVEGVLELNVHERYLPVMVVETMRAVSDDSETKTWTLPELSLSLNAPMHWQGTVTGRSAVFTVANDTGGQETVLTVDALEGTGLPDGTPAFVAGSVAVKMREAAPNGGEDLRILRSGKLIRLLFTPSGQTQAEVREEYEAVVNSITFSAASSSASAATATGALLPCGGEAGILCPQGYYCDVFDTQANIGKCRKP